ncbi:unnamed protein product, partial [Didymodactylos carnosus]
MPTVRHRPARQDIAFRGHTDEESNFVQLVNLLSRHNPVLQRWLNETENRSYKVTYMGHRSQNEFIQIIGEEIQRLNLNQIRQGTYYSIMADSTPDSNRQDMFTLVIRFVNDQLIPEERFVS